MSRRLPRALPARLATRCVGVAGAVALVATVLVTSGGPSTGVSAPAPDGATGPAALLAPRAGAAAGPVTKVLVVVEENHSLAEMRQGMPYTFGLAKRYGYATHYRAATHPSLPNYLAITGGSTFGVTDDAPPAAHPVRGPSVFDQALAHHETATVYAQAMPRPCALANAGDYAVRHNPWTYFVDGRAGCAAHDVGLKRLARDARAGTLPRLGLVVPDVQHDAHDGTLATADTWFHGLMDTVLASPDWASGHLAVVLTADEDDHSAGNTVLTVVMHPSQHHHVVRTPLTHYSLTRLYDEVGGLPLLRQAKTAPSLAAAFGLPLAG